MGQCNTDLQDRLVQQELDEANHVQQKDHKLLLLGSGSSGKSTFFKQLCQIHGNGFQKQDVDKARHNICHFVVHQMKRIVENCEDNIHTQEDTGQDAGGYHYALSPAARQAADIILQPQSPRSTDVMNSEIANVIKTLWNDPSIKHTFMVRDNLTVVDSAPHFFDDMDRIGQKDYVPTDEDILLVRVPTTGVRSASFYVDRNKFTLVDVGGQRNERTKWIHQFDMVDAVLFVASLSCYDLTLFEEDGTNAMHESIKLFSLILEMRYFRATTMILFLNKLDLFDEKIKTKPIKECFPDYKKGDEDREASLKYIRKVFETCNRNKGRELYTHLTCATDSTNVQSVFCDVEHTVIKGALQDVGF
eukprot:22079_1